MMAKKSFLCKMLVLSLVFGLIIAMCDNGITHTGTVSKDTLSAKWETVGSDCPYLSFKFTKDGVYIVIEKSISSENNLALQSLDFSSDLAASNVLFSVRQDSSGYSSNLSPIHTGKYRLNGSTITLEGFGVVVIITFTVDEFNFSFRLENLNEKHEYQVAKQENAIASSTRTDMLCRSWELVIIDASAAEEDQNYDWSEIIGGIVLFSKAGTYLVMYPGEEAAYLNGDGLIPANKPLSIHGIIGLIQAVLALPS